MRLLKAVVRYRMIDHKRNEDIVKELEITFIKTIRNCQKKWLKNCKECLETQ